MTTSDVRILVIDDSQALREFVVQALEAEEGYIALQASDGAQGLEMALADPPDLIISDLEMPRLDGFGVLEGLHDNQADIPVVLITSHGSEAIAVEFFRKGVKDYLIKPFTAEQMFQAVERALTEVRLRRERNALMQRLALTNRQLMRRVRELDALYQVGQSITSLLSMKELLARILDAAFYVLHAEEATLMLVSEDSGRLETEIHRTRSSRAEDQSVHESIKELSAQAARQGEIVTSGPMLAAPLKAGDRVIGVLSAGNRVSARPFSGQDRQSLVALADYATIGIENSRLHEEARLSDRAKTGLDSAAAGPETPSPSARSKARTGSITGPLTEHLETFASTILSSTEQMQRMLSNVRDARRIETGELALNIRPVRLTTMVKEALRKIQDQIKTGAHQWAVSLPEDLPPVQADPARLVQVLVDLLRNACQYTPKGKRIWVRAWAKEGRVYCAVSDSGIGIRPEDQAKLFTPFFRAEDPLVQETPGVGLGLHISKVLIEQLGGQIQVKSQPGQGTTVAFDLPAAEAE